MKVKIMTDTNSGISVAEGHDLGIEVLPMPVIVGGKVRTEGVDIDQETLYQALENDVPVSTSQPAPAQITDMWDRILAEGAESLVFIPMSSGLSGSCATARQLAQKYNGRVQVADNHRISVTQRSSVLDALALAQQDISAEEIRERLEKSGYDASIYICVDTLKHLKHSGRITAAGASLATAMGLHPILNIRGGKLDAQCVCRGDKHTQKQLIKLMETDLEKRFKYIEPENLSLCTAGTFVRREDAEAWTDRVSKAFPRHRVTYHDLSCSIACHVGCNALAIALSVREK